jgi:hypothetical protein
MTCVLIARSVRRPVVEVAGRSRCIRDVGRDYLLAHWPGGDDGFSLVERLL